MMVTGHIALASSIALVAQSALQLPYDNFFVYIYTGILFGSVLPDIDEPRSFIGRKLWFISYFINKAFKHRTVTHYLIFSIPFFIVHIL